MRIVLVDDQKELCQGLAKRIESLALGHSVVGKAYDGSEGEKLIRLLKPDLAFVDIRMPFRDGLQLLENIRAVPGTECRIVMLTAFSDFPYVQKALRLGAFDYMLKPVGANELRRLFSRCEADLQAGGQSTAVAGQALRDPQTNDPQIGAFVRKYLESLIQTHDIRNQLLLDSLEMMRRHFDKPLTLHQLSIELHVSESYLSRLFTRDFGVGFIKLLHKLRIELALYLLKSSKLTITEIAKVCGFETITYFGRVFKELTGRSASEFRQGELKTP